ncbi:hypothetical protein KO566_03730 [Flavobacteriaceae bacterium XHP0103]|uniref:hypothetical protein n=1 Tax=Marixanthotalea marina TaxID=2844359 RepID=UPI002989DF83|nr:hypothetical protein [Marixanthotalea marina]MBU3821159.1 hypothetical protein [Marixanthotalea marina]
MLNLIQVSKIVALISFIIGTTLFSLFLYLGESHISVIIGAKFLIVAVLINVILFVLNLLLALVPNENRIEYLKTGGFILLNIPMAILYIYVIIEFL